MNQLKGVSVIICCYNSAGRITPTLEHLQRVNSSGIKWEVIVVDNNSSDQTASITAEVWNLNPVTEIKIIEEKKSGLMQARIKGVSVSSYDIVSFIDDDNWVDEQWIQNVFRIIHSDKSIAACGGDSTAVFESNPPKWFTEFQTSFAVGKQQEETGYVDNQKGYLWGAGLSIRKSAWLDLFEGGFTSRLSGRKGATLSAGEDSEVCLALIRHGWKLWYDSSLKLSHYIPTVRLTEEYLKKMYIGFGRAEMILSVYRISLSDKKANPSWFLQVIAALKQLFRSGLKSIFSSSKNKFANSVLWVHDKAYVTELLTKRNDFYNTLEASKSSN